MLYEDSGCRFVAVLNRQATLGELTNALGHITAGFAASHPSPEKLELLEYQDSEGNTLPISRHPFIVLSAKKGQQLRKLRQQLSEQGIASNVFYRQMLGSSADEQMRQTLEAKAEELDYLALVTFGATDVLQPLIKRFSLFRGQAAEG